jgi:RNA polymerase sigma factor (sigma-70 family)
LILNCLKIDLLASENNCRLHSSLTDIGLWEAFSRRDRKAFADLFKRFYPHLYKYGVKITTDTALLEDCIQELFIELWQQQKPATIQSVKAYLIKALKYKLLKAMKKDLTIVSANDDHFQFELSHELMIISRQENEERLRLLTGALQQLSARQREIIYLKYFQELSYDEVSEIMNVNYQVARNLLYQAVKSLKKLIQISPALLLMLV